MRDGHPSGRPIRNRVVKEAPERPGRRTFPIVERLAAPQPANELAGGIGFLVLDRSEPDEDATVMDNRKQRGPARH